VRRSCGRSIRDCQTIIRDARQRWMWETTRSRKHYSQADHFAFFDAFDFNHCEYCDQNPLKQLYDQNKGLHFSKMPV